MKIILKVSSLVIFLIYISYCSSSLTNNQNDKLSTENQGLYNDSDYVYIINSANFNKTIYNSDRLWFLEFYNSWCGFCQRFAPSWKDLAERLKSSRDIIGIAAIDCYNEDNNVLCRNFEIMGYPTLRYFHENYTAGPNNLGMTVQTGEMNANSHIKAIANLLIIEQKQGNAKKMPNLLPYMSGEVDNIFQNLHGDIKHVFLIIENGSKPSYLGVEAILRFHKVREIMVTYSFDNNSALIDKLGENDLPLVITISRGNSYKNYLKVKNINDVVKHIEDFLERNKIEIPKDDIKEDKREQQENEGFNLDKNEDRLKLITKLKKMGDVVFQMDLETTLRFSLKNEIARTKTISGEKLTALKNYLDVIRKYFPASKRGQAFLEQLYETCNNVQEVSGKDFRTALVESESKNIFSSPLQFLGCKGSTPSHRGYPCGVWILFHYLTVNAADQNQLSSKINPSAKSGEVLNALYGYIKHFFGCADCSTHFQQMAEKRKIKEVNTFDDSILWLWKAHNVVNQRLAGDATEDPEFPKYQYPSADRCPTCRLNSTVWNEVEVLKYLKHVFSKDNIRYIGSDKNMLNMNLEQSHIDDSYNSSSIITTIDRTCRYVLILSLGLSLVQQLQVMI